MPARTSRGNTTRKRRDVVVIFGESENDREAVREFFRALRPDFRGTIKPLRDAPLLIKGALPENLPNRANILANTVRAEEVTSKVVCILAHEDCDDVEPAHIALSDKIETLFKGKGIRAFAATPAWEMETWLFLWPEATKQYRPSWQRPDRYDGTNVGMLTNAKEKFKAAVRPRGAAARAGVRDYEENDSPLIAAKVRELGIIDTISATSNSYTKFRDSVRGCRLTKSVFD